MQHVYLFNCLLKLFTLLNKLKSTFFGELLVHVFTIEQQKNVVGNCKITFNRFVDLINILLDVLFNSCYAGIEHDENFLAQLRILLFAHQFNEVSL